MLKIVTDRDIFADFDAGMYDAMAHGCNCFHTMGAGFAKQIKERYPLAYEADLLSNRADGKKLGSETTAVIHLKSGLPRKVAFIFNLYTQYRPGPNFKIGHLVNSLSCISNKFTVCMPKIGCGIGGGDWDEVVKVLEESPLDITVYEPPKELACK